MDKMDEPKQVLDVNQGKSAQQNNNIFPQLTSYMYHICLRFDQSLHDLEVCLDNLESFRMILKVSG